MKAKKILCALLASMMAVSCIAGCSQAPSSSTDSEATSSAAEESKVENESSDKYAGVTLSFLSNIAGEQSAEMEKVIQQFEDETGATVEYSSPGASYEELMKTKMATKDLPDLWTTHGWSVARYGQYLEPLNSQPWADKVSKSIIDIITDPENGNFYTLPVNIDICGIVYNKTVLEDAGVNPDDLKTWSQFEEALKTIKEKGYVPVHIAGKDSWTIGQFFDFAAPSFYITNEEENDREALLDGTFDWSKWEGVAQMMADWRDAGLFNTDCLTADYASAAKALGEGKVAFEFYPNSVIAEALAANPDAQLGMMPIPANSEDDSPTLVSGERIAIGVWKDSPNKEAALELLEYFAQPDNMSAVASSDGTAAGFDGVDSDTGMVKEDLEKYMAECRVFPYFDREYLPNGMWDDMCTTGASILANEADAVQKACDAMKESYEAKLEQAEG